MHNIKLYLYIFFYYYIDIVISKMPNNLATSKSWRYRQRKIVSKQIDSEFFHLSKKNKIIDNNSSTIHKITVSSVSEHQPHNPDQSYNSVQGNNDNDEGDILNESYYYSTDDDDDDDDILLENKSMNLETTLAIWAIRHGVNSLGIR